MQEFFKSDVFRKDGEALHGFNSYGAPEEFRKKFDKYFDSTVDRILVKVAHDGERETQEFSDKISGDLCVGGFKIDWTIIESAEYVFGKNQIIGIYDEKEQELLPQFKILREALIRSWEEDKAKGNPAPWNGKKYSLKKFTLDRTPKEETPLLRLVFGPTDYATEKVTDQNEGHIKRNILARNVDVTIEPVPQFASILAVNINIITADNYLVISDRNPIADTAGGQLHTSCGENFKRPDDAGENKAPDPFKCALRGIEEELALDLNPNDIIYTHFGVQKKICQYSLIGYSKVKEARLDVARIRTQNVKDKWENIGLVFVPCDPESISDYVVKNRERFFHIGMASVVLSLFQLKYPRERIEKAFRDARLKYKVNETC